MGNIKSEEGKFKKTPAQTAGFVVVCFCLSPSEGSSRTHVFFNSKLTGAVLKKGTGP